MTWLEFWDTVSVLQIVGWILGVLGIVAFAVKGWPTVRKFVAFVDALFSLPAFIARTDITLDAQDVKIEAIHHEVNFNNGSSVKDGVTRAENALGRVELGVRGLYDRVDALDAADIAATAIVAKLREDLDQTLTSEQIQRITNPKETR